MSDFDTWYQEIKTPDKVVTVRGEEFSLPADIPMGFVLLSVAEEADRGDYNTFMAMLYMLFGESKVTEWMKAGMSREETVGLLRFLHELYAPEDIDDEELADDPKV